MKYSIEEIRDGMIEAAKRPLQVKVCASSTTKANGFTRVKYSAEISQYPYVIGTSLTVTISEKEALRLIEQHDLIAEESFWVTLGKKTPKLVYFTYWSAI